MMPRGEEPLEAMKNQHAGLWSDEIEKRRVGSTSARVSWVDA